MECKCSSQIFIKPIKELHKARNNILVVYMPDKWTHGPISIIKEMLEAMTNITKLGHSKTIVPLIIHMHAWEETADAYTCNTCHAQPPAHLNGQCVSTNFKQNKWHMHASLRGC